MGCFEVLSSAVRPMRLAGIVVPLALAACAQSGLQSGLTTSQLETSALNAGDAATAQPEAKAAVAAPASGAGSATAQAIRQARELRTQGQRPQALAALDKAAIDLPGDKQLSGERGLIALELGQLRKAEGLLREAIDTPAPDARLVAALGTTLSAAGKQALAQAQFKRALQLTPDNPAILNNLALSYALDGKADLSEKTLRTVAGKSERSPHVDQARQNLALLLGLNGRFDEARGVAESVLPPDDAEMNMALLRAGTTERIAINADGTQPTYRLGGPAH